MQLKNSAIATAVVAGTALAGMFGFFSIFRTVSTGARGLSG